MVTEVIAYQDKDGEIHTTKVKAEQVEAWLDLLDAFDNDSLVASMLYDRREVIRRYFDATEALWDETMSSPRPPKK